MADGMALLPGQIRNKVRARLTLMKEIPDCKQAGALKPGQTMRCGERRAPSTSRRQRRPWPP